MINIKCLVLGHKLRVVDGWIVPGMSIYKKRKCVRCGKIFESMRSICDYGEIKKYDLSD